MKGFDFMVGRQRFRVVRIADYLINPVGGKRTVGVYQINLVTPSGDGQIELLAEALIESEVKTFIDGMTMMERFMRKKVADAA